MVASREHKMLSPGAPGRARSVEVSMHTVTLFPLGNADCCRIDLAGGQKILIDYANTRNSGDPSDKRVDLEQELRADLKSARRDSYDVVVFTHLDTDHFCGSTTFFELRHAAKYQGKDRIAIREMWVPASTIYEDRTDLTDEGRVIQAEARFRFKQGEGVRVFSRPAKLEAWLRARGLTLQSPGTPHHGCRSAGSGVYPARARRGVLRALAVREPSGRRYVRRSQHLLVGDAGRVRGARPTD